MESTGWLQDHLNRFVRPVIGEVPEKMDFFSQSELTVIKNIWRSAKKAARGRQMLLPGRDVFVFEILARREGFPTLFLPEISRLTVEHVKEDYSKFYIFDTGFAGSIPRALGNKHYMMASSASRETQTFPHLTGSRSLTLKIESMPKYWKRGFVKEGQILQELSDIDEFRRAAAITIGIYKNSAPKFIDKRQPIESARWQDSILGTD